MIGRGFSVKVRDRVRYRDIIDMEVGIEGQLGRVDLLTPGRALRSYWDSSIMDEIMRFGTRVSAGWARSIGMGKFKGLGGGFGIGSGMVFIFYSGL